MVWKIVLIKVYFTDLSEYKVRPVYIFKAYNKQDYMFLPLSSNLNKDWIIIDNSCLVSGKISKKSVVIIPKIWIIHTSLILEEIWELDLEYSVLIWKRICEELGCNYLLWLK